MVSRVLTELEVRELQDKCQGLIDGVQRLRILPERIVVGMKHTGDLFRFVRVNHNDDGTWYYIVGVWDEEGYPVICQAYADTLLEALEKLEKRLDAGIWTDDKFASSRELPAARRTSF